MNPSETLHFYTTWIIRLIYLNVLWILFTIIGFVIFGLFPATTGLFTVIRKWLMKESGFTITHTFWKAYKEEFKRANLAGLIFFIIGLIAYVDLQFIQLHHGFPYNFLFYTLIFIIVSFIVTVFFFFPVFVYFDLKLLKNIKQSFLIGITNPLSLLIMIAGLILIWFAIRILPGILPFFSVNLLGFIFMWAALRAFRQVENKFLSEYSKD